MYGRLISRIKASGAEVYGIEIYRGGETVFRHSFAADIRYPVYSAAKTVTSAAAGIACAEGKMSVSDPISAYIERKYLEGMDKKSREDLMKLPVERFLTMSVGGFPFRPSGDDWLTNALSCGADFGGAAVFSYSNISAYLVGIACANAVGEHLMKYLEPRFFEPLGIISPEYTDDPAGRFYGATGMKLTVHELSLLGKLYLHGGMGILTPDWVKASVKPHISCREGGYGYFIWCRENGYYISGKWGQKCIIYPHKELMITYMGNMPEDSEKMFLIADSFAEGVSE